MRKLDMIPCLELVVRWVSETFLAYYEPGLSLSHNGAEGNLSFMYDAQVIMQKECI